MKPIVGLNVVSVPSVERGLKLTQVATKVGSCRKTCGNDCQIGNANSIPASQPPIAAKQTL